MSPEPAIGIVTALPVESAAMRIIVDELEDCPARPGDPNIYRFATVPSTVRGRPHRLVLALQPRDGTRNASAMCVSIARSFPDLKAVVMCGIAGSVPAPHEPMRHVRLGDVVVATDGIVDYGHLRVVDGTRELRRPVGGVSPRLLAADQELQVEEHLERTAWYEAVTKKPWMPKGFLRPPESTDVLTMGGKHVPHPDHELSGHRRGFPKVHRGLIGSADQLLRDEAVRDELGGSYGIRAVEMEASGIAIGAELQDLSWFVVRGAADYCANATKNDRWHGHASLVAAAYVRALLGHCHPFAWQGTVPPRSTEGGGRLGLEAMKAIVDVLCGLRLLNDDYQRRAVLAGLPGPIRTAISDSTVARLHIISLVEVCRGHPGGRDMLLEILELALGSDSPDLDRVRDVFRRYWP